MITIRKAEERGYADHGWLKSYHTFSFASYRDPRHTRFRALRVMNEDWVAPGQGFGEHPHDDMEIVTYVLDGTLEHRDSLGNGDVLRAGEFQRMSAGTGITHSEFNPSTSETLHLYQIWLFPEQKGIDPSYEQKRFPKAELANRWRMVASPQGEDGALRIHQDVRIYLTRLEAGTNLSLPQGPDRYAWLQVLRGRIELAGHDLGAGDGVGIGQESNLQLSSQADGELLLFDLA